VLQGALLHAACSVLGIWRGTFSRQHTFWRLRWGRRSLHRLQWRVKISLRSRNIVEPTIDHRPEDVHQMLEESKKKHDEEDLQAVLASFKVDRWGNITKVKNITFTSTSTDATTEVIPNVIDSSSGVTQCGLVLENGEQLINN
jgi:glycyl-tRNA synthetase (class II)